MLPLFLGLRFLLELCLLAAFAAIGLAAFDGAALSAVAALTLVGSVAAVWGLFLAPKRRYDPPLPARLVLELTLYSVAGLGLGAAGFPDLAVALLVGELIVISALALMGYPPGGRPAADQRHIDRP